jgi:hypothetical protein
MASTEPTYCCKTCGEKNPSAFYVTKGKEYCKACVTKEKRRREKAAEEPLKPWIGTNIAPLIQMYRKYGMSDKFVEELEERIDSLNEGAIEVYCNQKYTPRGLTWREMMTEADWKNSEGLRELDGKLLTIEHKLRDSNKEILNTVTKLVDDRFNILAEENKKLRAEIVKLKEDMLVDTATV